MGKIDYYSLYDPIYLWFGCQINNLILQTYLDSLLSLNKHYITVSINQILINIIDTGAIIAKHCLLINTQSPILDIQGFSGKSNSLLSTEAFFKFMDQLGTVIKT